MVEEEVLATKTVTKCPACLYEYGHIFYMRPVKNTAIEEKAFSMIGDEKFGYLEGMFNIVNEFEETSKLKIKICPKCGNLFGVEKY